jgi:hypothetical protein
MLRDISKYFVNRAKLITKVFITPWKNSFLCFPLQGRNCKWIKSSRIRCLWSVRQYLKVFYEPSKINHKGIHYPLKEFFSFFYWFSFLYQTFFFLFLFSTWNIHKLKIINKALSNLTKKNSSTFECALWTYVITLQSFMTWSPRIWTRLRNRAVPITWPCCFNPIFYVHLESWFLSFLFFVLKK